MNGRLREEVELGEVAVPPVQIKPYILTEETQWRKLIRNSPRNSKVTLQMSLQGRLKGWIGNAQYVIMNGRRWEALELQIILVARFAKTANYILMAETQWQIRTLNYPRNSKETLHR